MRIWSSSVISNNSSEEGGVAGIEASGSKGGGELNDERRFHDSHCFVHKERLCLTLCDTETNFVVTYLVPKRRVHHFHTILGSSETVTVL
jgi:hypothetical protein